MTGFSRHISIARGAPAVKQVRYDPIGMFVVLRYQCGSGK